MKKPCVALTVATAILTTPLVCNGAAVKLLPHTRITGQIRTETGAVQDIDLLTTSADKYFLVTRSDLDNCNAITWAYRDCERSLEEAHKRAKETPSLEEHLKWGTWEILTMTVSVAGGLGLVSAAILKVMD